MKLIRIKLILFYCIFMCMIFSACKGKENPNKAIQLFDLAKQFAQGENKAVLIKEIFDSLTANEITELANKKEDDSDFAIFMVLGQASPESNEVVEKFIAKKDDGEIKTCFLRKD